MTKFLDDERLEKDFFIEVNTRRYHISSRWLNRNGFYVLDRWGLDDDDQNSFERFVDVAPYLAEIMNSIRINENGEFITLGRGVYESVF
jgi:hypothetical protein